LCKESDKNIGLTLPSSDNNGEGSNEKPEEPDWAEIFSDLINHTSLGHFEILELTIPQIEAYRGKLGKNIAIKIGIPNTFESTEPPPPPSQNNGKPPKLSQFMAFANAFNDV
jgi:hypothetical protein